MPFYLFKHSFVTSLQLFYIHIVLSHTIVENQLTAQAMEQKSFMLTLQDMGGEVRQ